MTKLEQLKTMDDFNRAPHLTDEERRIAAINMTKIPPTEQYCALENDPELAAFWRMTEMEVSELLKPDFQMMPFSEMNLLTLVVTMRSGVEAQAALFAAYTGSSVGSWGMTTIDAAKLGLINFPDSEVWTPAERLTIKFANALLDYDMPEELWSEALETWGPQKTLRYITWLNVVNFWCMFTACNKDIKFNPALTPPVGAVNPDNYKRSIGFSKTREGLKRVWENDARKLTEPEEE